MWLSVRSKRVAHHPELPVPILLCPVRRARRMRLRYDERSGQLKLTHPPGIRAASALAWAASHKGWVEQQLQDVLPPEPFVPGASIPVEGRSIRLEWVPKASRTPRLVGNRLYCGGSEEGFARRIEQYLRRLALEKLSAETLDCAARLGMKAVSVAVGDARTRWGSCSSNGKIRYSWRLILAAPEVLRYVVAHEVAHLKHLDHGREFKALERSLFDGDTTAASTLLRTIGPRLRRIGVAG